MESVEQSAPSRAIPTTGAVGSAGSRARDHRKVLLRRLSRIYAAERQLAFDLPRLFRQATELALRLVLADQRKETSRQLVRLDLIIQAAGGDAPGRIAAPLKPAERPVDVHSDEDFPSGATTDTILAVPLRQARGAIAEYQSAIAIATRIGLLSMADLLAESLNEKRNTNVVLSRLAAQPE